MEKEKNEKAKKKEKTKQKVINWFLSMHSIF